MFETGIKRNADQCKEIFSHISIQSPSQTSVPQGCIAIDSEVFTLLQRAAHNQHCNKLDHSLPTKLRKLFTKIMNLTFDLFSIFLHGYFRY